MRPYRLLGLLMIMSLGLMIPAVHADCDNGTTGNDTLSCTGTDDTNGVEADDGNDSVTVESGASVSNPTGDAINGGTGNDTIVNNGTVDSDGENGIDGGEGNDSIVNNDTIDTSGGSGFPHEAVVGGSGNDTIINNGTIISGYDAIIPGDDDDLIIINGTVLHNDNNGGYGIYEGQGGNDTVIVNGTIAPIDGETSLSSTYAMYLGSGDDSVTINGNATVIEQIDTGSGDDNVTVQVGATVIGLIDGGEDGGSPAGTPCVDEGVPCDTLFFHFVTDDEAEYHAAAVEFAAQLSNADPDGGSFTYDGQTYEWVNFEQLQWLVELLLQQAAEARRAAQSGGPGHHCTDTSKQIFILENGDIDVYSGFNENPNGFQVAYISVAMLPGTTHFATDPNGWYVEVVPLGDIYYRIDVYTAPGVLLPDQTPCIITTHDSLTGYAIF